MERINGETISGIALAFLAILFIYAAQVNAVWAVALPADYVLLAVGIALIVLGRYTTMNTNRSSTHTEEHSHH
jgi:nitrate reductase gamma subunit